MSTTEHRVIEVRRYHEPWSTDFQIVVGIANAVVAAGLIRNVEPGTDHSKDEVAGMPLDRCSR